MSRNEHEFDVDVDIRATVRVRAKDEDDALDVVETYVQSGVIGMEIHSVFPLRASEA